MTALTTHKYHAQPTTLDGIRFASKAEARRYAELRLLVKAGVIRDLVLQPRYPLQAHGVTIGKYVGDFEYVLRASGDRVIEDVKGVRTALYRWKKKHFEAQYGRLVCEV